MGVEPKFPGSSLNGWGVPQPRNRKARRTLEETLRRRLQRARSEPEPSGWVLATVIVGVGLLFSIMLIGFPGHRIWVGCALVLGCAVPFGIARHIVYSVRRAKKAQQSACGKTIPHSS